MSAEPLHLLRDEQRVSLGSSVQRQERLYVLGVICVALVLAGLFFINLPLLLVGGVGGAACFFAGAYH